MSREKSSSMPVFLFPPEMSFYLGARHTHKQLLTLYNPYLFAVDFKVLCTSPHKFNVMEPEGTISARSCMDIVVRYTQTNSTPRHSSDKFRITMLERTTHKLLGKQDIPISLIPGEPAIDSSRSPAEGHPDDFQPLLSKTRTEDREMTTLCRHPGHRDPQPVNIVAVVVCLLCAAALFLPTMPEQLEATTPRWFHITVTLKLVVSFVLGLVSMLLLRP